MINGGPTPSRYTVVVATILLLGVAACSAGATTNSAVSAPPVEVTSAPSGEASYAFAAPSSTPTPTLKQSSADMTIVGFDRTIAEQNGYEIVKNAQGLDTAVKRGEPSAGDVGGHDSVTSNCGTSWITFTSIGHDKANMTTGFGVIHAAVKYGWTVDFVDRWGVSSQGRSGVLANRTTWDWTPPFIFASGGTGSAFASVETGSYAVLLNGAVCYSGGPSAKDWIYN